MTLVTNPYPIFLDGRGMLLDGGSVYIGNPNTDPTVPANQIAVYLDPALTTQLTQPVRTLGGVMVNGRDKVFVYTAATDYSMVVNDAAGALVYSVASVATGGASYQPLDSDLTAIAALSTTPFGRALLTTVDAAALRAVTGIPLCLPLTGGNVTGNIGRGGAGVHQYWADPAMTSGRKFITAAGAADPTSLSGDEWLTY